ncbi:MAG TPA: DUF1501 domain-containing protein [Planctomycetaceae bacterium]|nr:DUF1501 domain-containing protein [Planctomycetaceae bacterium]
MLNRRDFLVRGLKCSSLFALGPAVPAFVASTARAAEPGGDTVLVVVELTGGNDGLNTLVPFGDDLYHSSRPTLRLTRDQTIPIDDHVGLNSALAGMQTLLENGELAIVQGVGYPNPNRSHFESMDIWQTADPGRRISSGWLARALGDVAVRPGQIPAFYLGDGERPLALHGSSAAVPTLNPGKPFGFRLAGGEFYGHDPDTEEDAVPESDKLETPDARATRKRLLRELAAESAAPASPLLQFARRTALDAYATVDRLQDIMNGKVELPEGEFEFDGREVRQVRRGLAYELLLVARMIRAGFGTRLFYVALDGFDTHASQLGDHNALLETLGNAVGGFFQDLEQSGDARRVVLVTFSEFGRRVAENASQGTDHGAASCLFVAGPAVRGGLVGRHPSLKEADLDSGDLRHQVDFRQVYATLLDEWLECDPRRVLGGEFEHIGLLA